MKGMAQLSLILATWGGVGAYLVVKVAYPDFALMAGFLAMALTFVMLFAFFFFYDRSHQKKYAALEKQITSPIFFKLETNFRLENLWRAGNFYFCEDGIYIAAVEAKPNLFVTLARDDIDRYEVENRTMEIYLKDGRMCSLRTAHVQAIVQELKQKGWI